MSRMKWQTKTSFPNYKKLIFITLNVIVSGYRYLSRQLRLFWTVSYYISFPACTPIKENSLPTKNLICAIFCNRNHRLIPPGLTDQLWRASQSYKVLFAFNSHLPVNIFLEVVPPQFRIRYVNKGISKELMVFIFIWVLQ